MAEVDLISEFEIDSAAPYSISKAATNAAVAKFHAQYKKENILFMSISPGYVDTGFADNGKINSILLLEIHPCSMLMFGFL